MNGRERENREALSLIQRLARMQTSAPDPAVEEEAIRAMEQWPLMGLLTQELRSAPRPVPLRLDPVDAPGVAAREAAPLDQMFVRLERITKSVGANGSNQAVQPLYTQPPQPVFAQPVFIQTAQPMQRPPAPVAAPPATEGPLTIEPRAVLHHDAAVSPARLFERMKG